MRKEKALTELFAAFVGLVSEECLRNPELASRIDLLLADFPHGAKGKYGLPRKRNDAIDRTALPDVYGEYKSRSEPDFLLWLVQLPVEALRQLIRAHDLDPSKRTQRWKEPEKLGSFICDQLSARVARGSRFVRGEK